MTAIKGKVIHLHQRDPQEALERLNRITGLCFSSWPQSLVSPAALADSPKKTELLDATASGDVVAMLSR